jgi:hypothetical protein
MKGTHNLQRVISFLLVGVILKHEAYNRFLLFSSIACHSPHFWVIQFRRLDFIVIDALKTPRIILLHLPVFVLQIIHQVVPLIALANQLVHLLLALAIQYLLLSFIKL